MAILQSTLNAPKSNDSGVVADLLRFMDMEGQVQTSALYICLAHAEEMAALLAKLNLVKSQGEDSIRQIMTDYWQGTKSGDELLTKHAALKAIPAKQRTQVQREQFKLLQLSVNNMSIKLQRAVFTMEGVSILRANDRSVKIGKVPGTKAYACYVIGNGEFEMVRFTAEQLRLVSGASFTKETATTDILASLTSSNKKDTPNDEKGANGTALVGADIGKAVASLDTTVAKLTSDDGKLAMSEANIDAVGMLWARCERTLTKAQKAKYLAKYDAEGTAEETKVA